MAELGKKLNGSGWILVIIAIVMQSVGIGWKLGVMEEKITQTQVQVAELKADVDENAKDIKKLIRGE